MKALRTWLVTDPTQLASPGGLFLLRLVFGGLLFWKHGVHKVVDAAAWLRGATSVWGFVDEIASVGLPLPVVSAFAATLIQTVAALGVILGFATRVCALLVAATLLGAVYTNVALNKPGELAWLYLGAFACLALSGPGRWSIDARLARARRPKP